MMFNATFSETVDCFVSDLKKALIKDIQKKIIESVAFVQFEEWWTDQEKKYKDKVSIRVEEIPLYFKAPLHVRFQSIISH